MIVFNGVEVRALHDFIQQTKKQPVDVKRLFRYKEVHDGYVVNVK